MKRLLLASLTCATTILLNAQANNYPNGSLVADFTVTDTHGNTHNLYTYTAQGKHVILDFFFDTCGPCQATSQYFSQLYQTYGCNGGDIICIAMNNGTDTNARWMPMRHLRRQLLASAGHRDRRRLHAGGQRVRRECLPDLLPHRP